MTTPGEVERVPIKVVPYYVQPSPEEEPQQAPEGEEVPPVPRRRTPLVGIAAAVLALGVVALTTAAIVVASAGDFGLGTTLAYAAIGTSILAVVVAIVGIAGGFGRGWAIPAFIVAVLANPIVLLTVLDFAEGLQTGA